MGRGIRMSQATTEDDENPIPEQDRWVKRNPSMWRHGKWNAETPVEMLGDHYLTPNDMFFIRSHGAVPRLSAETHTLTIDSPEGLLRTPQVIDLNDLKTRFAHRTITSALVCSGSRRLELNIIKHGGGHIDWHNAVGNAEWEGVLPRDVLIDCGVQDDRFFHVEFEGADTHDAGYRTSIPMNKVMDPAGEVLLAWSINGETLPPDHGYPLRV